MSRFSQPPDRVFSALDSSIGYDWRLGPYDVEQSRAHATMLAAAGIISDADRDALLSGLQRVERELEDGEFPFEQGDVDIHMAIERRLTEIAGPVGGKLHTARSRNDQVATDIAMFTRAHALTTLERLQQLQSVLVQLADAHLDWPMPGYTHLQRPNRSTSRTTCSPTSGCSGGTRSASRSCARRPRSCRSAPARWRA